LITKQKKQKLKKRLRTVSGKSGAYQDKKSLENINEDAEEAVSPLLKSPKKKVVIKRPKSTTKRSKRDKVGEFQYYKFDHHEIMDEIRTRMKSTHRVPGSPILSIHSMHTEIVTDTVVCPHEEMVRQRGLSEARIYMKLFYNEKEITQTPVREINGQYFNIKWVGQGFSSKEDSHGDNIESNDDLNGVLSKDKDGAGETKSTLISVVVNQEPKSIKAEIYEVVSDLLIITIGSIWRHVGRRLFYCSSFSYRNKWC
jgi:hypothetical protein